MWATILANAKFLVESKETCNHLVDESMRTKNYLNGPLGGSMGPQISALICSKNLGIEYTIFGIDGRVIIFPCEQAMHCFFIVVSLTVLGIPFESFMILLYIFVPGWLSVQCPICVISGDSFAIWYDCIFVVYRPGGIKGKVSLICGFPAMSCNICKVSIPPCFFVHSLYWFALISWKLIRFCVAVGAYVVAAMLILVPPDSIMVTLPLSSLWMMEWSIQNIYCVWVWYVMCRCQ